MNWKTPAVPSPIRVVVVEDEPLYRKLLCTGIVAHLRDVQLQGAFATAAQAHEADWEADVLLTDIDLGEGEDGYALGLRLATNRRVQGVVLLSNLALPSILAEAPTTSRAGWAYLLKTSVTDLGQVHRALHGAYSGELVIDSALTETLAPARDSALASLTSRQSEVLTLMANGWSNQLIAEELLISVRTVESVISDVIRALGIDPHTKDINARVACVSMYLRHTHRAQPAYKLGKQ